MSASVSASSSHRGVGPQSTVPATPASCPVISCPWGLVLVFVLIGGVFAATELASVSLRESQLSAMERAGSTGARVAAVARDPNRFLAAVQIGVTVAGFLSAAYGGATLAPGPGAVPGTHRAWRIRSADHGAHCAHSRNRLPVTGPGGTGAQAAGSAEAGAHLAGSGAGAGPVRLADAPCDLASLGLHQRRGAALGW